MAIYAAWTLCATSMDRAQAPSTTANLPPPGPRPSCCVLPAWTADRARSTPARPGIGANSLDMVRRANNYALRIPPCYQCGHRIDMTAGHGKRQLVLPAWTEPGCVATPCAASSEGVRMGPGEGRHGQSVLPAWTMP